MHYTIWPPGGQGFESLRQIVWRWDPLVAVPLPLWMAILNSGRDVATPGTGPLLPLIDHYKLLPPRQPPCPGTCSSEPASPVAACPRGKSIIGSCWRGRFLRRAPRKALLCGGDSARRRDTAGNSLFPPTSPFCLSEQSAIYSSDCSSL